MLYRSLGRLLFFVAVLSVGMGLSGCSHSSSADQAAVRQRVLDFIRDDEAWEKTQSTKTLDDRVNDLEKYVNEGKSGSLLPASVTRHFVKAPESLPSGVPPQHAEAFEKVTDVECDSGEAQVHTVLIRDGVTTRYLYLLKQTGSDWRITAIVTQDD